MLTAAKAARLIDISAVRTHHTLRDIEEIVAYAKEYKFINVHTLPCWTRQLAEMLAEVDGVFVGAPVAFPSGAHTTAVKLLEARQLLEDGVEEMDIVMNIGRFKNQEYDAVLNELQQVIALAKGKAKTKVIIEINLLSDTELDKACELVIASGADFVKTGTGWVPGDLNMARIARMCDVCKSKIQIKVAGGIRTASEFQELYQMGVQRMGINAQSAIEIVKAFDTHA